MKPNVQIPKATRCRPPRLAKPTTHSCPSRQGLARTRVYTLLWCFPMRLPPESGAESASRTQAASRHIPSCANTAARPRAPPALRGGHGPHRG